MELGLEGRVALVMAASRGIGRGIATVLAREGARVAIASRTRERIEAAAEEIAATAGPLGGSAEVVPFVADTDDLDRLAELPGEVEAALGPVEVLVLNSGGPPFGGALDQDLDEWNTAYRSLVLAPRVLAGAVVPGMRERGWGRIVNVGSSSTREPIPALNLSNANRMAAVGFLKTLATDVAGDGITVNTVATGLFATERLADSSGSLAGAEAGAREDVPAGRLGQPEEYGDLVAFLCSERAAYLTGTVIPLDGGALRSIF
ncbi:MAG TPA: SDR family oxidoreductase [Solirubrobacterales bacterium]|nr:SDR family oxidoreductase [Solirubrobacterales bacterium]